MYLQCRIELHTPTEQFKCHSRSIHDVCNIVDVECVLHRGYGLFIGVEIVNDSDKESRTADRKLCLDIVHK